ncbi:glycosyltransferase [bacterium]|nr:glycosyltransferase [bacterium]
MTLAPIVLFVYNRPWHTQQTVEALQKNDWAAESDLFIFADGAKTENDEKVNEVRKYIKTITGFKSITIFEKEKNCGLANSVIAGVAEIINKFGKVIVVEDDIVTSKYFLKFMNEALNFFENDERIFSVSGYTYHAKTMEIPRNYKHDIYLSYRHGSWGWGTWKDRWESVDWDITDFKEFCKNPKLQNAFNRGGADMSNMLKAQMEGKIDSWAIRFDYSLFKQNKFNIRPVKSLVTNVGLDNSGTHTGADEKLITILDDSWKPKIETIEPNKAILKNFRKVFDPPPRYSLKRFIGKVLKRFFH